MKLPQWFSADGQTYLGAMPSSIAPEGAIQSPEEIFDARGVTLNVETMQVSYVEQPPSTDVIQAKVAQIQALFEALGDTDRRLIGAELVVGLNALQLGSDKGVGDSLYRAGAIAQGNSNLTSFLTSVQTILGA